MPATSPLQVPSVPPVPAIDDELDPLNPQGPTTPTATAPAVAQPPAAPGPVNTPLDQATETVEGRVGGIIKKGGALQQLAATRSKQQSNKSGLLNTSMAVGAGQKALIESALPIAQADTANAVQLRLQREKEGIDKRLLTASADEQIRLISKKGELDTQLQKLSGEQSLEQIGLQGEQAIAQIGVRGKVEEGLIDRRGAIEKQLQSADAANRSRLLSQQASIDHELVKARGDEELRLRSRQGEIDAELQSSAAGYKSGDLSAQQLHETQLNNERIALEERMTELQGDQREVLQKMQGEQAVQLEDVRGFYDGQISTQKSAAVLYNTSQQTIASMLTNPDLTPTDRTAAIQYQLDNLNASLGVLGAMGGVDVSSILGTPADTGTQTTDTVPSDNTGPPTTDIQGPNGNILHNKIPSIWGANTPGEDSDRAAQFAKDHPYL